jgi:hypothetical protein
MTIFRYEVMDCLIQDNALRDRTWVSLRVANIPISLGTELLLLSAKTCEAHPLKSAVKGPRGAFLGVAGFSAT